MGGTGYARGLAAALSITCAVPLTAQGGTPGQAGAPPGADGWKLDAAMLGQMCSASGSFQFTFGQQDVPGSSSAERAMRAGFALPEDAAPFVRAQPASTKWSNQFFAIEFAFTSDAPDDEMEALYESLDAWLTADGWLQRPEGYDAPLYQLRYAGDLSWYKPTGTAAEAPEIMLDLSEFADEVTLSCARSDLALLALEEELGRLPKGTPRPLEPQLPMVPVPSVADCARPEITAEIDAFIKDGTPDAYVRTLLARGDYQDRLSQWMMWRLEEAGASSDEVLELALDATLLDGGPEGFGASLEALLEVFPLAAQLEAAKTAGDRDGVCRAFVDITAIYQRLAANAAAQTRALQASYRREAPKYGIDPEE